MIGQDPIARLRKQLQDLSVSLPRQECASCDCFQGFLTQLEIDFGKPILPVTGHYRVDRVDWHGCLGCDPCPPGGAFADYIRKCKDSRACECRTEKYEPTTGCT